MATNELIGIASVFVLTFCLIALYHFIGAFGRHRRTYGSRVEQQKGRDRSLDHKPHNVADEDDSWLLWDSGFDDGPPWPPLFAPNDSTAREGAHTEDRPYSTSIGIESPEI